MNERLSVEEYLNSLPEEGQSSFTKSITIYINDLTEKEEIDLLNILESSENEKVRFGAFYSLMVFFRRSKMYKKSEEIALKYAKDFTNKPLLQYQLSYIYRHRGGKNDLRIALQYADKSINIVQNNKNYDEDYPGLYNNYAEIVAQILENEVELERNIVDKAFEYINKAIMINIDYAKYYFNLGKLQCYTNDFESAKINFIKAIDMEDSRSTGFAIRISEYQDYLMKCNTLQAITKLNNYVKVNVEDFSIIKKDILEEFKDAKKGILEFIAFFSAIITFIISSIQISTKLAVDEAVTLILVMLGALIVAFGAFRMILDYSKKSLYITIAFLIIGLIIIWTGINSIFI